MNTKVNKSNLIKKYLMLALSYVGLFLTINVIHFHFFNVNVILYTLLFDLIISLLVVIIGLAVINKNFYFNKNLLLTILLLIATSQTLVIYAFVVPTAIERSLSVYLLEQLESNKGVLSISDFNIIAKKEYFNDMNVVETRINEQIVTGSIIINSDKVVLTDKGKALLKVFSFIKKYLLPQKVLIKYR